MAHEMIYSRSVAPSRARAEQLLEPHVCREGSRTDPAGTDEVTPVVPGIMHPFRSRRRLFSMQPHCRRS